MRAYDLIAKTKRGIELTEEEIQWLVTGYVSGKVADYQMSAWLMAVCLRTLTAAETTALTLAMRDSGAKMDLSGIRSVTVDKHSTGGVGDKTSLLVAPIVAACGVAVPKMSGRGLGHTGGTIDKLESIPGFSTEISFDSFIHTVNEAGCAIVSQSGDLVPADKKMYALRDATATVDSIPLICASIMSKKLAMGADCIVLDVKVGSGAFMKSRADAEKLAAAMVQTAALANKRCRAVITDMDAPLGRMIGNALEVKEAISILRGEETGSLTTLCIQLAGQMLSLAGKGDMPHCAALAEAAIRSGAACERFRSMLACQGGDTAVVDRPELLPQATRQKTICAPRDGYLLRMDSEQIGLAAMMLGAGRTLKTDQLDLSAGIALLHERGDYITCGEPIMTLYSSIVQDFAPAAARVLAALEWSDNPVAKPDLIYGIVG